MRGRTSSKKVAPFGRPRALPLTPIADRDSDRRRGKVSTPVGLAKLKTTRLLASLRNCTPINLSLFRGLRLAPMLQQPSLVVGCQCARSHPQMKASVPRPRSLRNNRTRTKTTSRSCFTGPYLSETGTSPRRVASRWASARRRALISALGPESRVPANIPTHDCQKFHQLVPLLFQQLARHLPQLHLDPSLPEPPGQAY